MNAPERLTGPVNELTKERNRAAAERTLGAWIIYGTTFTGFGIALNQIRQALQVVFPDQNPQTVERLSQSIGLIFIAISIITVSIAIAQHILTVQSLNRGDYIFLPSRPLNFAATLTVILFGLLGILVILLGL